MSPVDECSYSTEALLTPAMCGGVVLPLDMNGVFDSVGNRFTTFGNRSGVELISIEPFTCYGWFTCPDGAPETANIIVVTAVGLTQSGTGSGYEARLDLSGNALFSAAVHHESRLTNGMGSNAGTVYFTTEKEEAVSYPTNGRCWAKADALCSHDTSWFQTGSLKGHQGTAISVELTPTGMIDVGKMRVGGLPGIGSGEVWVWRSTFNTDTSTWSAFVQVNDDTALDVGLISSEQIATDHETYGIGRDGKNLYDALNGIPGEVRSQSGIYIDDEWDVSELCSGGSCSSTGGGSCDLCAQPVLSSAWVSSLTEAFLHGMLSPVFKVAADVGIHAGPFHGAAWWRCMFTGVPNRFYWWYNARDTSTDPEAQRCIERWIDWDNSNNGLWNCWQGVTQQPNAELLPRRTYYATELRPGVGIGNNHGPGYVAMDACIWSLYDRAAATAIMKIAYPDSIGPAEYERLLEETGVYHAMCHYTMAMGDIYWRDGDLAGDNWKCDAGLATGCNRCWTNPGGHGLNPSVLRGRSGIKQITYLLAYINVATTYMGPDHDGNDILRRSPVLETVNIAANMFGARLAATVVTSDCPDLGFIAPYMGTTYFFTNVLEKTVKATVWIPGKPAIPGLSNIMRVITLAGGAASFVNPMIGLAAAATNTVLNQLQTSLSSGGHFDTVSSYATTPFGATAKTGDKIVDWDTVTTGDHLGSVIAYTWPHVKACGAGSPLFRWPLGPYGSGGKLECPPIYEPGSCVIPHKDAILNWDPEDGGVTFITHGRPPMPQPIELRVPGITDITSTPTGISGKVVVSDAYITARVNTGQNAVGFHTKSVCAQSVTLDPDSDIAIGESGSGMHTEVPLQVSFFCTDTPSFILIPRQDTSVMSSNIMTDLVINSRCGDGENPQIPVLRRHQIAYVSMIPPTACLSECVGSLDVTVYGGDEVCPDFPIIVRFRRETNSGNGNENDDKERFKVDGCILWLCSTASQVGVGVTAIILIIIAIVLCVCFCKPSISAKYISTISTIKEAAGGANKAV